MRKVVEQSKLASLANAIDPFTFFTKDIRNVFMCYLDLIVFRYNEKLKKKQTWSISTQQLVQYM